MAKTKANEISAEATPEEAKAFLDKMEAKRLKRNADLRAWRADPKNEYKKYYSGWLAKRAETVAEAKRIVAAAEAIAKAEAAAE